MLTSNIGLQELQSHRRETLFLFDGGFQVQKLITLTSTQTYYLALDPTGLNVNKKLGTLPLAFQSSAGLCYAYTYASTLSATGSEITPIYINQNSTVAPTCKFYSGCTPSNTSPANPREYMIGVKGTNQSSGGGASMVDVEKQLSSSAPIIIKLVNQESANNIIAFGLCWFEY